MTSASEQHKRAIEVVQQIGDLLAHRGVPNALIGALALAVHGYPRSTTDVDLATDTDPFTVLREVTQQLKDLGFDATLNEPDADDSLGGLIRIESDEFDRIDIVNFFNPLRPGNDLMGEALKHAQRFEGFKVPVVSLPYLIALKLYAGGNQAKTDVVELIERNSDDHLPETREVCRRHGLGDELETLLKDLGR